MNDLPEEYLPKVESHEFNTPVVESISLNLSPEAAQKTASEMGLVAINRQVIQEIQQLGEQIEGVKTIRLADGFVVATQEHTLRVIARIGAKMEGADVKTLQQLGHTMGYLANAMAKCSQVLKSKEQGVAPSRKIIKGGFEAGQIIDVPVKSA